MLHSKQKLCKTVRPSLSRCAIATLRSPVTASPELEMAPAFERPTAENPERDLTQCEPVHFKAGTSDTAVTTGIPAGNWRRTRARSGNSDRQDS